MNGGIDVSTERFRPYELKGYNPMFQIGPQWFCSSKDSRRNNSCIITRSLSDEPLRNFTPHGIDQENSLKRCYDALRHKPPEGCFWVATYDLSLTRFFKTPVSIPGKFPAVRVNCFTHEDYAINYDPQNNSKMGFESHWFLYLLYLNFEHHIPIELLLGDSSNFAEAPSDSLQPTSKKLLGGIADSVGNTSKIVKDTSGYCLVSTSYQDRVWRETSLGFTYSIKYPNRQKIPSAVFTNIHQRL